MAPSNTNLRLSRSIISKLESGGLSTPDLAAAIRKPKPQTYRLCCRLEEMRLLKSSLQRGRRLLFCVDDRIVVTTETYEDCKDHELRFFYGKVRVWKLALDLSEARARLQAA